MPSPTTVAWGFYDAAARPVLTTRFLDFIEPRLRALFAAEN